MSKALDAFVASRSEFCSVSTYRNPALYWDARGGHIGASEASCLFQAEGWCAPWLSEYAVAVDKADGIRSPVTGEWLEAASALEMTIAQMYANKLGHDWIVERPGKAKKLFVSSKYLPLACTPDAFVIPKDPSRAALLTFLAEFKAPASLGVWRELPKYYEIQATAQMIVLGVERCIVVALFHGVGIREFPVELDRKLADEIIARAARFWHVYVMLREPPPIDGSDATTNALKARIGDKLSDAIELGPEAMPAFEEYAVAKANADRLRGQFEDADVLVTAAKNRIRDLVGAAEAAQLIIDGKSLAKVSNRWIPPAIVPSYPKVGHRNFRITLQTKD